MLYHFFRLNRKSAFNVDSIMPCDRTISNRIKERGKELVQKMSPQITEILDSYGGAISVDYGKKLRDFIGVYVHFIDAKW